MMIQQVDEHRAERTTDMADQDGLGWAARATGFIPPSRRADVVEAIVDDEVILSDLGTGDTHRLNETALAVWRGCDGARTIDDIAEALSHCYEVDPARARNDIEQLLILLAEARLLGSSAEDN